MSYNSSLSRFGSRVKSSLLAPHFRIIGNPGVKLGYLVSIGGAGFITGRVLFTTDEASLLVPLNAGRPVLFMTTLINHYRLARGFFRSTWRR